MSEKDDNLVNEAKRLLIERENLTESEAHRILQKRAMDRRITKEKCALEIIEKYN